jgi:hypothetical protein
MAARRFRRAVCTFCRKARGLGVSTSWGTRQGTDSRRCCGKDGPVAGSRGGLQETRSRTGQSTFARFVSARGSSSSGTCLLAPYGPSITQLVTRPRPSNRHRFQEGLWPSGGLWRHRAVKPSDSTGPAGKSPGLGGSRLSKPPKSEHGATCPRRPLEPSFAARVTPYALAVTALPARVLVEPPCCRRPLGHSQ